MHATIRTKKSHLHTFKPTRVVCSVIWNLLFWFIFSFSHYVQWKSCMYFNPTSIWVSSYFKNKENTFLSFLSRLAIAFYLLYQVCNVDSGAIFLRWFRLYMLSFMFRFMFENICFEKNQNIKIHVMFITKHNMKWNIKNQVLPSATYVMLSININHNMGFFHG